jgi:nucleotide-binding universal stress UspA family protein
MYKKILVPVDLAHIERLDKAITTTTDLARHYGIPICLAGATTTSPSEIAPTPEEFTRKLEEFWSQQAQKRGLEIETAAYPSTDLAAELDYILITAAADNGADLMVMASHVPGFREHIFASNAGYVASHADVSVFVVR